MMADYEYYDNDAGTYITIPEDTVLEAAIDLLEEEVQGEDAAREAYRDYYMTNLAEAERVLERPLTGREQQEFIRALDAEAGGIEGAAVQALDGFYDTEDQEDRRNYMAERLQEGAAVEAQQQEEPYTFSDREPEGDEPEEGEE